MRRIIGKDPSNIQDPGIMCIYIAWPAYASNTTILFHVCENNRVKLANLLLLNPRVDPNKDFQHIFYRFCHPTYAFAETIFTLSLDVPRLAIKQKLTEPKILKAERLIKKLNEYIQKTGSCRFFCFNDFLF